MKIKLEFEQDDFREMIQKYFKDTGWVVLNLEDIVDQFETAFPGGIIVEAAINKDRPQPPTSTTPTVVANPMETPSDKITPTAEVSDEDDNPVLPFSSLTGPQDDDDSPDEISNILKQSESLKSS